MDTLGLKKEKEQIAERYLRTLASNFKTTGRLWETYDGRDGTIANKAEYATQEMMGWTAGTFEAISVDLSKGTKR